MVFIEALGKVEVPEDEELLVHLARRLSKMAMSYLVFPPTDSGAEGWASVGAEAVFGEAAIFGAEAIVP